MVFVNLVILQRCCCWFVCGGGCFVFVCLHVLCFCLLVGACFSYVYDVLLAVVLVVFVCYVFGCRLFVYMCCLVASSVCSRFASVWWTCVFSIILGLCICVCLFLYWGKCFPHVFGMMSCSCCVVCSVFVFVCFVCVCVF